MIKTIKNVAASLMIAVLLAVGTVGLVGSTSFALDVQQGASDAKANNTPGDLNSVISTVVDILLYVIGIISVIMLIVGGIRYTISNGAQDKITLAKNTIMYAIVGLVIAFLAYAIVHWVIGSLSNAN